MRTLAPFLALLLALSAPTPAQANALCRWTGLCIYLSPGFTLTVIDAETGKPLPDVYAWAEWVQYGAHGRGGPLMVQDATTNADGRLAFPSWGPTLGSPGGLLLGLDPAVIVFKQGYETLIQENGVPLGADHRAAIRGLSKDKTTLRLRPLRGSTTQQVEQLRQLAHPPLSGGLSERQRDHFRSLYIRRTEIVTAELARLPSDSEDVVSLRSSVERDARFFRGRQ
jgi:hypothetical protein